MEPPPDQPNGPFRPEFIRIPRPGTTCPYTGLSRSCFFEVIADGKVRSFSLRKRGRARGVRLVELQSLIDYIRRHEDGSPPQS